MRIILFGSTGMLGGYIHNYLKVNYEIIDINRNIYDSETNSFQDLINICNQYNISNDDVIINCMGLLPHRFNSNSLEDQNFSCEILKKFILVNSIFPHNLEKIYLIYNCKIIHITSDCVYSGNKGNYDEKDDFDLFNTYGITKTSGEPEQCCNIRTSIIGHEKNNKKSLLEWIISQKDKTINGYFNYLWNGLTCLELSKVIENIIKNNKFWKGVRHIYSSDSVSKYELCKYVNEIYKLNIQINEFNLPNKVDRTLSSIYKNDFNILPIKEQIIELKNFNI
jgi:dTDP-4-dehydrorhamnose reductase